MLQLTLSRKWDWSWRK